MVSKFFSLLRERQYDVMVLFYRYVIATCFRKILYRLQHSISRPFFTSVTGVSIFKFPEHPQTPCSPSELQRDSDFLTAILSFETENPIPNLNEQAKAARDRLPFKVYTEETHIELHTLLCELLKRFQSSLETLAGYHSVTGSSGDYQHDLHATANIGYVLFRLARSAAIEKHFKAIESSLADRRRDKTKDVKLEEIKKELELGTDFYDELDAELYNEHFGKMDAEFKALNTEDAEKDEEDTEEDEEDAEEDEEDAEEDEEDAEEDEEDSGEDKEDTEARGGQPPATWKGSSTPALWQSYLDWLRLMVVHFEAVWTLANCADDDKFDTIFRIVYPPDVTSKMLSWRQLLSSPHFPNSVSSTNVANRSTSDIVAYLEASVLERGAVQHIIDGVKAFDKPEASFSSTVSIIQAIKKLPFLNCQSPTWNTYAERIFSALKLLEEVDPSESHCLLTLIVQMLEVVRDNTALLHQLNQQKLHSGNGFDAPVHCELVLGSLISRSRTDTFGKIYEEYKDVLDELKVRHSILSTTKSFSSLMQQGTGSCVGVSRRCCPVCAYMLHEMPTGGGESFVARPSHSTISACALPIWLPEAVVKKGNQAFGSQLRQELIEMMSPSPDSLVESRKSSDSQDLPLSDFAKASLAEKVNTSYRIGGVLKKGRNDALEHRLMNQP